MCVYYLDLLFYLKYLIATVIWLLCHWLLYNRREQGLLVVDSTGVHGFYQQVKFMLASHIWG